MFEDTNQTELVNEEVEEMSEENFDDGSELFADFEEDTHSEEEAGEEEAEEAQTEEGEGADTASAQSEKVKLTFLGKEQELTMDELITLAQKGLNYDHLKGESDKNARARSVLEKYAKFYGRDLEEYIGNIEKEYDNIEAQKYASENNVSEDGAKKIMELQRELEGYKKQNEQSTKRENMRRDFSAFMQAHPDLDVKTLPQEIFNKYLDEGMSFEAAYAIHENERLKSELAAERQNNANKQTAVGSVKDEGGAGSYDPFLAGFNG